MKKTSPKKLHPMAQTNRQTDRQTDGHGGSMTDPAQRAEPVKIFFKLKSCSFIKTKIGSPLKQALPVQRRPLGKIHPMHFILFIKWKATLSKNYKSLHPHDCIFNPMFFVLNLLINYFSPFFSVICIIIPNLFQTCTC